MRARPKLVGLLKRVRSLRRAGRPSIREDFFPQFYVRQLEQRRVLSVNVNAGADQTDVDEGEVVTLDPATFSDHSDQLESHTAKIDWGDGITAAGTVNDLFSTVSGSHSYADNGIYTVTVSVTDAFGETGEDTLSVTVDNVAPSLIVAEDQTVDEGALLDITDIGMFTDPGFDNPLNVGGELTESFFFNIDWGDATLADFGVATIDAPGGPGVLTAGSFDGSHIFAAGGTFTVTITVLDDDGGSDVGTFEVFVIPITVPPVGGLPQRGGALADLTLPELIITPEPPRNFTEPLGESDFRPSRSIASPVAEKSYVLRVVSPTGKEGDDVPLKDDVLDQLTELFAKLPDDHYRIYLIRADGTERLVLDFQIRGGRPVDPADAAEQLRDLPPQPMAEPNIPPDAAENDNDRQSHLLPTRLEDVETAIASVDVSSDIHQSVAPRGVFPGETPGRTDEPQRHGLTMNPVVFGGTSIGTAAAAIVYARGTPWQRRVERAMRQPSPRSITKTARLCRRIRQADTQDRVS